MSTAKSRLDNVEACLTPKQAVILWMEEAHQFPIMAEHVDSLVGGPDIAWPMYRLPDQVAEATKKAMKGRSQEEVSRAVRDAIRDVAFLFHLHQQANSKVLSAKRTHALQALLLITESRAPLVSGTSQTGCGKHP